MSDPIYTTRASAALYDTLCPGRHLAQQGISEFEPDEDAQKGTRIHALYAGKECEDAEEDEIEAAQQARALEQVAYTLWLERIPKEVTIDIFREERMTLMGEDGLPYHTGQPDMMAIAVAAKAESPEAHVFINDLKALWGLHDPSDLNLQLRDYAALIAMTYDPFPVASVTVNLMQPNKSKEANLVLYDETALMIAESEMMDRIASSRDPAAARVPGPRQCKYCLAKMQCPEHLSAVKAVSQAITDDPHPTKASIENTLTHVDNAKLLKLLENHELLEQAHSAIRNEAKRRLARDPLALPGWRYRKLWQRRKVNNPSLVYQRLANFGVPAKEFADECTITLAGIKSLIRKHSKVGNKELTGEALMQVLEDAVKDAVVLQKESYTLERDV